MVDACDAWDAKDAWGEEWPMTLDRTQEIKFSRGFFGCFDCHSLVFVQPDLDFLVFGRSVLPHPT